MIIDGKSKVSLISRSFEETYRIGKIIGKNLTHGDVVALIGELGAGKTSIAQGIAKGLGVLEHVTSPTFNIINEYEGVFTFYHFDLYRIQGIDELNDLGYEEYFFGDGVCVIEWAEKIKEILPEKTIFIFLIYIDETSRKINIYENHLNSNTILKELESGGF